MCPLKDLLTYSEIMKLLRRMESTLKKKHNALAHHRTQEAIAAGSIRVAKEDGKTNLADLLTKTLPQATRDYLCNKFMY